MKTIIIGNGIVDLTVALRLAKDVREDDEVVIIGRKSRPNSATMTLLTEAMEQINTNFYKAEISTINMGYRPVSADTFPVFGKTSINNFVELIDMYRYG